MSIQTFRKIRKDAVHSVVKMTDPVNIFEIKDALTEAKIGKKIKDSAINVSGSVSRMVWGDVGRRVMGEVSRRIKNRTG